MKKKLITSIIILLIIVLAVIFSIFKKQGEESETSIDNQSIQENFEEELNNKKESHPGVLANFETITEEEYQSKRKEYYKEFVYKIPDNLPENVTREGDCLFFNANPSRKLELCDYIPKEGEEEINVSKYKNPLYLKEQGLYLIWQGFYEGGKMYLASIKNPEYPTEIPGGPIFREDNKYFFVINSTEAAYQRQYGLIIWKLDLDDEYGNFGSEVAHFGYQYFGNDILEGFWVGDDIYLKTQYLQSYNYYLKLKIEEFPNLPRG